jgi:hypothetical protein
MPAPPDAPIDLTGRWRVIHNVERSEVPRYIGLKIEFDVALTQEEDRVRGEGEKFIVGWELVAREESSHLWLDGRRYGRRVRLSIIEKSARHPEKAVTGEIDWEVITPDILVGTFQVNAGNSSGASKVLRRH